MSPLATTQQAVTTYLRQWRDGDDSARDRLVDVVYQELHRLAEQAMRGEREGHTLQPTDLVSEAYLRLVAADVEWEDREHFYAVAARIMRRILVDHARAKQAAKRGGGRIAVTLEDGAMGDSPGTPDLLALDQALDRLAEHDERKARAIELHYFAGLSYAETARALGMSEVTVHRDLRMAKAWLYQQLS